MKTYTVESTGESITTEDDALAATWLRAQFRHGDQFAVYRRVISAYARLIEDGFLDLVEEDMGATIGVFVKESV